ncbi:MAG: endonuclease/exonuclease/phosphatase family protein [Arenicella sp.]|nr:endonuclease/exonuclease/phosphatase family protein [Arenicella sp.]
MNAGWLLLITAATALYLIARKATPATAKSGGEWVMPVTLTEEPGTINVASFNIQTGKSLDGKRNIDLAAAVLAKADLAGIQEVYAPTWLNRIGLGRGQPDCLSAGSGASVLFCATRRRWFREHRGNALLSKLPVISWRTEMLPDRSGKSYRNMTVAEVSWQNQRFHFINTHLHTRAGRDEQLKAVLQEFTRYPRAILVGDFNTTAADPMLKAALEASGVCDTIAELALDSDEEQRIDWILTRGFKVVDGQMLAKGVSDHPYYQVSLVYV